MRWPDHHGAGDGAPRSRAAPQTQSPRPRRNRRSRRAARSAPWRDRRAGRLRRRAARPLRPAAGADLRYRIAPPPPAAGRCGFGWLAAPVAPPLRAYQIEPSETLDEHRMDQETVAGQPGRYWHRLDDGRIQCDVCPRYCRLMRASAACASCAGARTTRSCSRPTAAHPASASIRSRRSRSTIFFPARRSSRSAPRAAISPASSARTGTSRKRAHSTGCRSAPRPRRSPKRRWRSGCRSVAFTYNDPVIFLEYAVDVAQACRARGIKTVAVSAGYITPEPRREFFRHMDAANIDLKGFTETSTRTCARASSPPCSKRSPISSMRPRSGSRSRRCSFPAKTTRPPSSKR